jgi:transposase, IS6 family
MRYNRSALFRGRHFAEIIALCVRWYLRFSLSYRDLEELMAERNLSVDHTTVWRWVQCHAPELNRRVRRELKRTGTSWRVDETEVLQKRSEEAPFSGCEAEQVRRSSAQGLD